MKLRYKEEKTGEIRYFQGLLNGVIGSTSNSDIAKDLSHLSEEKLDNLIKYIEEYPYAKYTNLEIVE